MSLSFLNLALLAGLAGLAIPPIIHFFHRRRHDVVDWGAMQFLEISTNRRRKFFLEELLLLLARMALVALLVFFLAQPMLQGWLADRFFRPSRDVMMVVDTSASMTAKLADETPWQHALDAVAKELEHRGSQDRIGLMVAGLPTRIVVPLTSDASEIERALKELPTPSGAADGPAALEMAWEHLQQQAQHADREIVMVCDRQVQGWSDAEAMTKWRALGDRLRSAEKVALPRIRWLATAAPASPMANYSLEEITPSRRFAGVNQTAIFSSVIVRHGDAGPAVLKVRFEIDGKVVAETKVDAKLARTDVRFDHRFERAGAYLATIKLVDAKDALAADDRQDFAFEVLPELPVLLVDAEEPKTAASSTFYLQKAFADPGDKTRTSLVSAKAVRADRWTRDDLFPLEGAAPRVVVLADVAKLTDDQTRAINEFVEQGGGVLQWFGPRSIAAKQAWTNAKWMEGVRIEREVSIDPKSAPIRLDPATFHHPGLTLFADPTRPSLGVTPHRHWAKHDSDSRLVVARFANGDPWLLSRKIGNGQVLLSALPMDASWEGMLAKSWEFPVLAHELVFALADAKGDTLNLSPGQPIPPRDAREPKLAVLHGPGGGKPWRPDATGVYPAPGPAGVYRLEMGETSMPLVVRSDSRESVLTYASEDDVKRIEESFPARWSGRDDVGDSKLAHDAWLAFLVAFVAFLVLESWMTRRLAKQRARA